jgi:glutathione peroxidase
MTSSILDIPVNKITGEPASLAEFKGKVILVVNVASKCGLTPQYEAMEKVYELYRGQGLVVAGFPANDFAGQEPAADAEIQTFCTMNFGVQFPMFSKINVVGADKHPLYAALIAARPRAVTPEGSTLREHLKEYLKKYGVEPNQEPELLWNFEKFLIGRSGEVVKRFSPDTAPDDPSLIHAIDAELAKS